MNIMTSALFFFLRRHATRISLNSVSGSVHLSHEAVPHPREDAYRHASLRQHERSDGLGCRTPYRSRAIGTGIYAQFRRSDGVYGCGSRKAWSESGLLEQDPHPGVVAEEAASVRDGSRGHPVASLWIHSWSGFGLACDATTFAHGRTLEVDQYVQDGC